MSGEHPDYESIYEIVCHTGWNNVANTPSSGKGKPDSEPILSLDELKRRYFDEWYTPDPKSGLTYDQKIAIFFDRIQDEENDTDWRTIGAEVPFDFEFRPGVYIRGFIDKVQQNSSGKLRIVDYKTSKAVYDSKKLTTPLQLFIYHLACAQLYPGHEIAEYMYDFVLLGETRLGGSKGWLTRASAKLVKLLDAIEECEQTGIWKPSSSPLCYWCPYCANNPNAQRQHRDRCPYYSLWTPSDRKNFSVNMRWYPDDPMASSKQADARQAYQGFRW